MDNDVNPGSNSVIELIRQLWGRNVQIKKINDDPYDNTFTLNFTLYRNKHILAEYKRSSLGLYVFIDGKYTGLSKLTNESIFKRPFCYCQEHMLHNFKILDKVLKAM